MSDRVQRLQQHHHMCQKRLEDQLTAKNVQEHQKTLQLLEMMKRRKVEQEEEQEDCDASLSDSSHDLEIDTSDSESTCEVLENNTKSTLKINPKLQDEPANNLSDSDDNPCNSNVDKDETTESKVSVKSCRRGQKRKFDKKHYCVYCKHPQSKMARHLKRNHSNEKEVALALCENPKACSQILASLRKKGDYYHNVDVLKEGKGEIVTYRQPTEEVEPNDYLPCNKCFGFFYKNELWRHEKQCKKNEKPEVQSKQRERVQSAAISLLPHEGQASQRCSEIISRMIVDKVSIQVKNDPLICEYGERLLEGHGSDQSKDGHVSQKMRELGRFLLAARSMNQRVKNLQDILVPPYFKLAVDAAKKASGFLKAKYRYDTPSLAIKLGYSLKTLCEIVIGQHVKDEDDVAAARVRSFLGLVSTEWGLYVSRRARTNLEEDRWNKKDMIPLTADVMKLNNILKSTKIEAKQMLLTGPNPDAYKTLSESLLSQIILFNRRRQGEAARIPLLTYKNRVKDIPNEDVMQCLSKFEQNLSNTITRLVIRGKRGRKVVLLTSEMTESLDFLIKQRNYENGVLESNDYVFARQNSESHLRGSDCLRKYANACDAERPETLTSTYLRKHVATLSQIMNLKDNELDQLANFMGHDVRVHREYYRLTENTLQLAKISKLLMAIECGTEVYKGKSLDEISLDIEVPPASQISAEQTFEDQSSEPEEEYDEETPSESLLAETSSPRPDEQIKPQETASSKKKTSKRSRSSFQESYGETSIQLPDTSAPTPPKKPKKTQKTGVDPQTVPPKKGQRRSWTSAEKQAVWKHLGKYMTLQRVPGKEICDEAIDKEPDLSRRDWRDVKNYVYNYIVSSRRKQL